MNILMLARWLPVPCRAEEARREYRFARRLLEGHRLTLAFLTHQHDVTGAITALRAEFDDIEFAVLPRGWQTLSAAVRTATGRSGSVTYFRSEALRTRLAHRLSASPWDLIYVSSSSMMQYAVELDLRIPVVADFGEVDSEWWAQRAAVRAFPAANFCRTEAARLRLAEAAGARRAIRCIAASAQAARVLAARIPDVAVTVIPNGVDEGYFVPVSRLPSTQAVAIVGQLDGAASVETLARFCLTTVPAVRAALPDVRFVVASRNPPIGARRLAEIAGIEVMTPLDDLRPVLHGAALAVAPLPPQGTLPIGILEAMLTGLPVVATRGAAEGLDAVPGRDFHVENNPSAFAGQVIRLLASPEQLTALAARGQAFARTHHSWEASTSRLLGLIEASVGLRKPPQPITVQSVVKQPIPATAKPRAMRL
jgi:glycosyltransferase involved in cell wall biosynthesis